MQVNKDEHPITRIIFLISRVIAFIAIGFLGIMMVFTVLDVFLRAVFDHPIVGSVELIEYMMVIVGFLGLAWCGMKGLHIKVEMVVTSLSSKIRGYLDIFNYLVCLVVFSVIAWRSFLEGNANVDLNLVSPELRIPTFPFYWATSLGYGVLCLVIIVLLIRAIMRRARDES